jgi:hypothetical protein
MDVCPRFSVLCCPVYVRGCIQNFRTGSLEREMQMVQLSATRCSCIAILWVSLVSFATITLCVTSERVIPNVNTYFVIDSVRTLLDTPSRVLGDGSISCLKEFYQNVWTDTHFQKLILNLNRPGV